MDILHKIFNFNKNTDIDLETKKFLQNEKYIREIFQDMLTNSYNSYFTHKFRQRINFIKQNYKWQIYTLLLISSDIYSIIEKSVVKSFSISHLLVLILFLSYAVKKNKIKDDIVNSIIELLAFELLKNKINLI